MLLEDLTIPAAAFMSIFFLKIKYSKIHFIALAMCFSGMIVSFCNDLFKSDNDDAQKGKNPIIGDILALSGAFLYALSNILQEHFLK
jgi:solute carrier family 35 protein F1/2